ncbi:MAG: peroxiredoxin [Alphaproteobacteria bacterium]|nr:peroxiredoxin [Alphaproteobacteria bacterium]
MTVKIGDKIPTISVKQVTSNGAVDITTDDLFNNKTSIVFALPGAFTPVCSAQHLPGFIKNKDKLKEKGIDQIICLSVNDVFVMGAWADNQNVQDSVIMIADGNADLTKAVGLDVDLSANGMGIRSQRYLMVVKNGVVTRLEIEPLSACSLTSADHILDAL